MRGGETTMRHGITRITGIGECREERTMNTKVFALILVLASSLVAGCVAVQPLPIAARSGDTITLALGSQEGMTTANTTATFTSDSTGVPVALTPKAIFNLYGDKRSALYHDANTSILVQNISHEQWITVMVVDLPPDLPAGFGTIEVTTAAPQAEGPNAKLENVDIRFEVLAGVGQPHSLRYSTTIGLQPGGLNKLGRTPGQVYVTPPAVGACPVAQQYAAIEFRIRLPFVIEPYRDVEWFRVVADDFSTHTGAKPATLSWSARGDELRVVFMNDDGTLACYETRFSLVPLPGTAFAPTPSLLSVTHYDENGAIVPGPALADYDLTVR